jgi:hypothetical protein
LKPGLMFKGKGLEPGAFQLWVRGSQRVHSPTKGMRTLMTGTATKRKFSASFSLRSHSRARSDGTVNIHTLHMPISRAMLGSSGG